jgi:hypothetical protein
VTKTFKTGVRYRVVFSLPSFVPQSLVLGELVGHVESMSVKSLDDKRFQLEATWIAKPRKFSNQLLESVEVIGGATKQTARNKGTCPKRIARA